MKRLSTGQKRALYGPVCPVCRDPVHGSWLAHYCSAKCRKRAEYDLRNSRRASTKPPNRCRNCSVNCREMYCSRKCGDKYRLSLRLRSVKSALSKAMRLTPYYRAECKCGLHRFVEAGSAVAALVVLSALGWRKGECVRCSVMAEREGERRAQNQG